MLVTVVAGDITLQNVDGIVNAAHPSLLGGGGVDGAIHRRAGPQLRAECEALSGVPYVDPWTQDILDWDGPNQRGLVRCVVGQARVTAAFALPAKVVIHTVGPLYKAADDPMMGSLLFTAYRNSLLAAQEAECRTVALPALSCGVFGYPLAKAATRAMEAVYWDTWAFEEIRFVMFEREPFETFTMSRDTFAAVFESRST